MKALPSALAFLLMIFAGWVNRQQLIAIEYLKAENEMLREGSVAKLAKPVGFDMLAEIFPMSAQR